MIKKIWQEIVNFIKILFGLDVEDSFEVKVPVEIKPIEFEVHVEKFEDNTNNIDIDVNNKPKKTNKKSKK